MVNQEFKKLSPEEVDMFDSTCVYLVLHTEHKHTSLYSWSEEMAFVWVGAEVEQRRDDVLAATDRARSLGSTSKLVTKRLLCVLLLKMIEISLLKV